MLRHRDGGGARPHLEDLNVVASIVVTAGALAAAWFGVAFFRQRLAANDDGVHVRNLTSSFTVPWSEIERFEPPAAQYSSESLRGRSGLRIVTTTGATKYALLWGESRISRKGFAQPVVDELTRWKATRLTDPS